MFLSLFRLEIVWSNFTLLLQFLSIQILSLKIIRLFRANFTFDSKFSLIESNCTVYARLKENGRCIREKGQFKVSCVKRRSWEKWPASCMYARIERKVRFCATVAFVSIQNLYFNQWFYCVLQNSICLPRSIFFYL